MTMNEALSLRNFLFDKFRVSSKLHIANGIKGPGADVHVIVNRSDFDITFEQNFQKCKDIVTAIGNNW